MNSRGFTLIEVLVVTSIIALMSGFLITSFSRSRVDLNHTVTVLVGEIRDTQSRAVASSTFRHTSEGLLAPVARCGYGITPNTATQFYVYAGANAENPLTNCTTQNKDYGDPPDKIVRTVILPDPKVELKKAITGFFPRYFYDVFYEPPDPKTYIDNNATPGITPAALVLGPVGTDCQTSPSQCKVICLYVSGKIETPTTTVYPYENSCP
ncbi:MAG: prepilin-type N-terminal cleavage/methylation domain-containing protein [Candidatus Yanofskybacteria bacterium]|nr:prepilin-type N-terminal cleavage/methylation domain-containing protein [Candidatus Yanofskybacteria bacterium]